MNKSFWVFIVVMVLLVGCTNDTSQMNEPNTNDQVEKVINDKENENQTNDQSDSNDDTAIEDTTNTITGYKLYRPKEKEVRVFEENGVQIYSEEVVAVNDEYVQMIVTLGGNKTVEIYKWTEEEISLVYQDTHSSHQDNILEGFSSSETLDTIVSNNEKADWELIEKESVVELNGEVIKNVLVVEKVTDEVVNEETIYKRYYAPEKGLIKEIVEVTGENGYKAEYSLVQ